MCSRRANAPRCPLSKFAYATNGHRIIEIDCTIGIERQVDRYATPDELFARLTAATHLSQDTVTHAREPFNRVSGKVPHYYQQIAIGRLIEAMLLGQKRILATRATGTGQTCVAFQICWKLWNGRWNRSGEYCRRKILFLADRNILVQIEPDGFVDLPGGQRTWDDGLGLHPQALGLMPYRTGWRSDSR
ncbi:MAG: DEAD/DEAH box helicase family protein [Rhodoferax sp.]|nr:DEAD/DEAH box helicase family protein [Rhodoferax sp.]